MYKLKISVHKNNCWLIFQAKLQVTTVLYNRQPIIDKLYYI